MSNLNRKVADARLDAMLEKALVLKNQKKFAAAARALLKIIDEYPDSATAHGLLGGIYFSELDEPKKARKHFAKTVKLSPKSELASLGLFHSLWNLGEQQKAFDEMRRFLQLSPSPEYSRLLKDMSRELGASNGLRNQRRRKRAS